jgi:hypothetical protein
MTIFRKALVLPAASDERPRPACWAGGALLGLLYREIDTDCIDSSPDLTTPYGVMRMWVADDGLLQSEIKHNDRAIAICRAVGYDVPDVGGTAVFTGGTDDDGDTLGIPDRLCVELIAACWRGVA